MVSGSPVATTRMLSGGTWGRVRVSQVRMGAARSRAVTKSRGISRARRVKHRHGVGQGFHRQFMGPVDEFPDEALDDLGRQVQAVFQAKGGEVFVAQVVAAVVALLGQVQEGGHDVGHHPVDIEGQGVQGDEATVAGLDSGCPSCHGCHFRESRFLPFPSGLQVLNDLKQVIRPWISLGAKHAHETFGRYVGSLGQRLKTNRRVDIIAQNGFAGFHVTGQAWCQCSSLSMARRNCVLLALPSG